MKFQFIFFVKRVATGDGRKCMNHGVNVFPAAASADLHLLQGMRSVAVAGMRGAEADTILLSARRFLR